MIGLRAAAGGRFGLAENIAIVGATELALSDQMRALFWSAPRLFRIGGAILVVALLILAASDLYGDSSDGNDLVLVGVVASLLLWPVVVMLGFHRFTAEQRQITYEIDSTGIMMRDMTGAASVIPWTVVRRVIESRSGFAITLKPAGTRWLPKRAFTQEAIGPLRGVFGTTLGKRN